MKALLIMNPGSRSGTGTRLWAVWESALRSRNVVFDTAITMRAGHGVELAASSKDYDTIVAVGGDGTINEALDGVIQSGRQDLRLGVLYSGTSPDFCRFHGIPVSPSAAVATLASGTSGRVDVARITYTGTNGDRTTAHFGCAANVGLGASVARVSNRIRGVTGDFLGTCIASICAIVRTAPQDLDITADGLPVRLPKVNNLSVLKSPFIASGLRLNMDLRPDDGKLAVFAVYGKDRLSALSVLPAFYSGKAAERSDVFARKCSRLRIDCSRKEEVEFDGDPRGFLPAEIEVLPCALNLIGANSERT